MEHVEVPIVRGETSLRKALDRLKESKRFGLVVDLPDRPRVLFADELRRVLVERGEDVQVKEVSPRYRAVRVPPTGSMDQDAPFPEAYRRGLEATLSSLGAQYAVLTITDREAHVVAASERAARRFTSDDVPL
jgi:hypothetical protein